MENLLLNDGIAQYYGKVIPTPDVYLEKLLATIEWKNDEVVLFGKRITTKRKTAWHGSEPFAYKYSGATKTALPWTKELLELKAIAEELSRETYNSCLLNLYHDGSESMGWHSDDEKTIVKCSAIASISLGADRKFAFRHKRSKETVSLVLENGSLLVMKGETQEFWQHAIPKQMKVLDARVNLTFRKFG
ncbi:MAG: alpha-ketoglutarate-dependent dioxygenase AlkB [Flavobacterium sp.]|uniref:alpha-ketoglutarate-dependent dioxygenase AlkB family protein n=1 Tax=Flavobacterium sp. TaxID=239 RepID=UPI00121DA66B|nr:alpha-ketoglutarate-dependent dioxygenase AlkB [Flavobacterium sp.]RZJ67437.1 MAG: alpha-ketoglutarate-dependent dioxygenase AlkB [Flavobacterium sp.]